MPEQGQCVLLLLVRHPGQRHPWTVCQSPELELRQAGPPTGPQRPSRTLGKAFPGALASDPGPPSFSGGPALWSPSSHCSQEALPAHCSMDSERLCTRCQLRGHLCKPLKPGTATCALPSHLARPLYTHPLTCPFLSFSTDLCAHSGLDMVPDTVMSPHPTEDYVQDQGSDSPECPSPLSGA